MKFNLFKIIAENISQLFNSNNEIGKTNNEEKFFAEKFNEFLKIEDCLFCYTMMDEGYKPSNANRKQLNSIMLEKIEQKYYKYKEIHPIKSLEPRTRVVALLNYMEINDSYNYQLFDRQSETYDKHILEMFTQLDNQKAFARYFIEAMQYLKNYYASGIDMLRDFHKKTSEQNNKVIKHNNNLLYVTGLLIKNDIYNKETVQYFKDTLKEISSYMEIITSERWQNGSFNRIGKNYIDGFVDSLSKYQAESLGKNNNKENVLRQLKSFQSRQKSLTEEITHLVVNEEYSIENLPVEAKNKVNNITKLVNKMDNEDVSNFVKERLPVILKKYFSIDEEYRSELKNVEGFNAQELMLQSLDNIERIVKAKQEDNNYDLLSELSVENRKLKVKV